MKRLLDAHMKNYKSFIWHTMNTLEKPVMRAVFMNGRIWRAYKNKFLTIEPSRWPLEDRKSERK